MASFCGLAIHVDPNDESQRHHKNREHKDPFSIRGNNKRLKVFLKVLRQWLYRGCWRHNKAISLSVEARSNLHQRTPFEPSLWNRTKLLSIGAE